MGTGSDPGQLAHAGGRVQEIGSDGLDLPVDVSRGIGAVGQFMSPTDVIAKSQALPRFGLGELQTGSQNGDGLIRPTRSLQGDAPHLMGADGVIIIGGMRSLPPSSFQSWFR